MFLSKLLAIISPFWIVSACSITAVLFTLFVLVSESRYNWTHRRCSAVWLVLVGWFLVTFSMPAVLAWHAYHFVTWKNVFGYLLLFVVVGFAMWFITELKDRLDKWVEKLSVVHENSKSHGLYHA